MKGLIASIILSSWATLTLGFNALGAPNSAPHSTDNTNNSGPANVYVSDTDRLLTIHKVAVLPATDNEGGLYARYVENKLGDLLKNNHRFNLAAAKDLDPRKTLEDYEGNPALVKKIGAENHVDALIGGHVNKLKTGVEITLDLFLTGDGALFSQETSATDNRFGVTDVEIKTSDLLASVIKKIPYAGMILSRQGNRVTMDIGTRDGVHDNTVVSVEQVILLKRHPRFHFILASEKEILGKIRIVKADETLSFGTVLSEKEPGVISTDSKVTGLDFVNYGQPLVAGEDQLQPAAAGTDPSKQSLSFGKHPKEWLPPKNPSLGKIGIALGLGSDNDSLNLASGNQTAGASIYPQLDVSGEIWLTPNWFAAAEVAQGVMSINNPGGTGPSSLGANNAHYDFHGGYKFLLQDDFYGPLIDTHLGLNKFSFSVDSSSSVTSITYSGLYFGLGGSAPITVDRTWYVDADLDLFIAPTSSETPGTSGNTANASVTKFDIGASYKMTPQFWIHGHLNFEVYSTNYADTGNSSRQQLITLLTGVEYMF